MATGEPAATPGISHDLTALQAVTEAVSAGAGLPEVVRAASRALDASMILLDHTSAVLAKLPIANVGPRAAI